MLHEQIKKEDNSYYMFINYAENNVAYRFLVLKNDMLDCNTIIEAKNAKFFKYIYPLKK